MEVMNLVNFKQLQQKINGLSKEYFSYSTSMKDHDVSLYKPANGLLHIGQEKTAKLAPSSKNKSHFLIVWGCGEFGQHGSDQSGDVTFEMAIRKFKSDESIKLPHCEFPVTTFCGSSHTLLLTGTDHVYSWGNGTSGQLGNGTCLTTTKPTLVPLTLDNKIQGMSCGARHSFIWTNNGYCYSFGNNFNAQLGYNFSKADFKENQLWPVLVELFPDMKVKEVSCGARHSLFLLTTGRVMAVGCNQHGQIGNDTTEDVVIPTMLDDLHSITHVACGNIHSLASHENGSVYAWGYGKAFGNKTRHVATPQKFAPKDIESSVVISLAGGDCHSMALYDCGVVFTWGNNYEGQLGVGKDVKYQNEPEAIPSDLLPRPVIQVACGETTSAAVTGKGELFMWGKNAGLIHSDKSSQYFQYTPHHIEMDGMSVVQISCGAWHVSAIVKYSTNETEEISQNLDSESLETEQPDFPNQKLDLVKNAGLPCENRDDIVSEDSTEQQRNRKCGIESMDTNMSDSSLDACFITKCNSQTEVPRVNIHDNELSENSLDTCFITNYSSDSEFSMVENECCENEILATDKQLTRYSEEVISDQEQEDCFVTKTEVYGVDKTGCRTNETRNTNVMDSSFGHKEIYEESRPSRQHENRLQLDEARNMEKQSDSSSTSEQLVGDYPEGEIITTYSEKEPSLRYSSECKEEERHKGNSRKSLLRNENAATYCTFESENVCSIEFDTVRLEKDKRKNNDSLPNKCEDFRNDVVKDNHFLRNNSNEDTRNKNDSLTSYNEHVSWNNDYILGNNCAAVNVDIIENNKGSQIVRKNHHLKHWNDLKSQQAERKPGPIAEKNVCEDISGLSLGSLEQNSIKESSVLKRNIRLAITPLQNGSIKHNSALKRNTEIKPAVTPAQYKTMEQTTAGSKLAVTSTQNKNMDCDNQLLSRQQTVPVIDLSFGKAVRHVEQSRIKPSFTTFRNVWKASNLFKEKQRQKRIGIASRRGSDGVFTLENTLPNRPVHAVREIEKWSKFKEDFTQLQNDSTQELRRTTDKLSKCCHDTGEVLPPICSCKKNYEVVLKRRDTLTNIFIDRR